MDHSQKPQQQAQSPIQQNRPHSDAASAGVARPPIRHFIGGEWVAGPANINLTNPSTGEIIGAVPVADSAGVAAAVAAAQSAFGAWRSTPVTRRVAALFRFAELLRLNEAQLARLIAFENGKSIEDAVAELKRTLENVQVACSMPALQQGVTAGDLATGIDGSVVVLPRGVYAVIAPFNFPAMVPFWFVPYAIAAGNSVVVKPSEQAPLTICRLAELLAEAGLPAGVLNLVHGDRTTAEALIDSPGVCGVSFVGSTPAAKAVHLRAAGLGKRVQAMGGAKNHLVVMADARLDQVVRNMVTSCFGCAGQRCMAASVIVCVGQDVHDAVRRDFVAVSREIVVADPLDESVPAGSYLMGPVISAAAQARIEALVQTAVDEGATVALDGRRPRVHAGRAGYFVGPTVVDAVQPGSTLHRTEVFGPVAAFITVPDLDAALAVVNSLEFGNGASIYTQDGGVARRFKIEAQAGMIGINVGIPAPVAYLPFGGTKASLFSDIKAQSAESLRFFVETKTITERYW